MMIAVGSDGDSSSEEEKPKKKASPTVTAKKAAAKKKKSGMQSRDRQAHTSFLTLRTKFCGECGQSTTRPTFD